MTMFRSLWSSKAPLHNDCYLVAYAAARLCLALAFIVLVHSASMAQAQIQSRPSAAHMRTAAAIVRQETSGRISSMVGAGNTNASQPISSQPLPQVTIPKSFPTMAVTFCVLFGMAIVLTTAWFLKVFTADLSSDKDDPATQRAIGNMVYFCYCFIIISLVICALPMALVILPTGFTTGIYRAMIESPMAIGLGCVQDLKPEHKNWELVCQPGESEPDQWLINIGGDVMALFPPPCPAVYGTAVMPSSSESPAPGELTGLTYCFPRIRVHGGLSVPFYFVFVSLLGAAVSMTRRIPEYQRRVSEEAAAFSPARAREKMIFQIVQFVSAPLIAITVYVLITPENATTSIAVAFASGFSSELVIKTISYAADQLDRSPRARPAQHAEHRHAAP